MIEIDGPQHRNRAAADHDGHSIPAPNTSSVVIALAAYHESAMTLPREPLKIGDAGYDMSAAPPDAWRLFDPEAPDPGYFEFDWISARHPDLYHRFALTTEGLTAELQRLVDFRGLDVIDVGAGTGRSAIGLASSASHVLAVDAYASVIEFGKRMVHAANVTNVTYSRADRSQLPVPDSSVDAVVCCWAELDRAEAARVLKPNGWLIHMGGHPDEPGELQPLLDEQFPQMASAAMRDDATLPDRAPVDLEFLGEKEWPDVRLADGVLRARDFTYTADYGSPEEAAAIFGRIFGPKIGDYFTDRNQATNWSRLRIYYGRVAT